MLQKYVEKIIEYQFRMSNPQYLWYNLAEDFDVKNGWLINVQPTKIKPNNSEIQFSAVDLFFMEEDGS